MTEEVATVRPRRLESALWTIGTAVAFTLLSALSQAHDWGLFTGVAGALVLVCVLAAVVGMGWHRAGAATVACVFGAASLFFTGPAIYEQYLSAAGEASRVEVVAVQDEPDRLRSCTVRDATGRERVLEQRQNCFGDIEAGETVWLYTDPLGVFPARLAVDRTTPSPVAPAIGAGLLLVGVSAVLYGGLRRRDSVPSKPVTSPEIGGITFVLDTEFPRRAVAGHRGRQDRRLTAIRRVARRGRLNDPGVPICFAGAADPGGAAGAGPRTCAGDFTVWTGTDRARVLARVTTRPDSRGRVNRYEVHDDAGRLLATVERRPAGWLAWHRTRWTVSRAGRPDAVGRKGHPLAWVLWWLTLPLQSVLLLITVATLPLALIGLAEVWEPVRPPMRTRWRADGRQVLEYRPAGPPGDRLHAVEESEWELPVAAAMVGLLRHHAGFLSGHWRPNR
jgi:hypothetical protein